MTKPNLHEIMFPERINDIWSGYVRPANGRWVVRLVAYDPETRKRRSYNRTYSGTREQADLIMEAALERARAFTNPFKPDDTAGVPFDLTIEAKSKIRAGSMSEMIACAALLRRGYDTYRSVAAAGACDLIALDPKTGLTCRVEVKTAHRLAELLKFALPVHQRDRHDVLALVVLRESSVEFRPDIGTWFTSLEQENRRLRYVG